MAPLARPWQRWSKRRQLVVGGFLVLCGLGLLDAVAFRPLRHWGGRLRREVAAAERRLVAAIIATEQADASAAAFEAYAPYVQAAATREADVAGVLTEIESSVRDIGMVLLNLRPVDGAPPEAPISATVEVEASPQQLTRLLDRLQRSARLLRVAELQVRVSTDGTLRTSMIVSKLRLPEGAVSLVTVEVPDS